MTQPEKNNIKPAYRPDIDGLRAIAVLSVVVFHTFPHALPGGFVGVDIFFVISGYLISSIIFRGLQRNDFSLAEFYLHRIRRIFPALIVVLFASYTLGYFTLLPGEFKQLGKHIAAGVGFVQNFVLLNEISYFDTASELKPLLHLWSLAIEEQFYLIYPLLMIAAWRLGLNLLSILLFICIVSFGLNISEVDENAARTFFMPQTRFWELLTGSVIACTKIIVPQCMWHPLALGTVGHRKMMSDLFSIIGLSLIITSLFLITKYSAFPGWWAVLPVSGACVLVVTGPQALVNRIILSNRLMVFIGLISYPLYLWHWPVLAFTRMIQQDPLSLKIKILAVSLSILLAWMTYFFFEKPIRLGRARPIKAWMLSAAMVVVAVTGFVSFKQEGYPFRFDDEIREIANFTYEPGKDARSGKCWLSAKQVPDDFHTDCIELIGPTQSDSILIWGDSHAARLYPGLRETLGKDVALSQLTRDSCPPLLDFGYEICQASNRQVMLTIKNIHPTTVVMFAVWDAYEKNWGDASAARASLLATVEKLKEFGVKNVVILGPSPHWTDDLPKLVFNAWRKTLPRTIPDRLAEGLMKPETRAVDQQLAHIPGVDTFHYVSVLQQMCDGDGCLTHVPGHSGQLITWDSGHLTTEGAVFLSRQLLNAGVFTTH